ncbi:hypothetical protein [Aestuariivirga sp.]|jgi:hypothetical protein|uniref:hypothetical protein n=1 Tax=Aestuariivirga sp. TaxID=2650926 RepID=UPI003784F346
MAIGFESLIAFTMLFVWAMMATCLAWQYHVQNRLNQVLRLLETYDRSVEQLGYDIEQCDDRLSRLEAAAEASKRQQPQNIDYLLTRVRQLSQEDNKVVVSERLSRQRG